MPRRRYCAGAGSVVSSGRFWPEALEWRDEEYAAHFAHLIPGPGLCGHATYRMPALTYPMTSNRYAVQYKLGSGDWTDVKVYISYYGGTNASPYRSGSGYTADTSMSFASIPGSASTAVARRVTKLWGSAFPAINHVSVRPQAKGVDVADGCVGFVVRGFEFTVGPGAAVGLMVKEAVGKGTA
jgi:hypothetical protein